MDRRPQCLTSGNAGTIASPSSRDSTPVMASHRIAVIAGDGIGREVVPEGLRVLEAAARKFDIGLSFDRFDWSADNYDKIGAWMPPDWKDKIGGHHCIYFGACGFTPTDAGLIALS